MLPKTLSNIIFLILFLEINSQTYYLDRNYNLQMEKGDSLTFIVPDNYRFTNILVYCSLEDTMEITNGGSTVIRTRMYIINTVKFNEETTYKILLKAKNKPYNFQSLFITSNFLVQYEDGEFQTEFSTSYEHFAGALIFVDARNVNKEDRMLFYRHLAGNDINFFYFPLTNDINFREICYNYHYKENSQTGNPFYPNDDYFILKYIGSAFDIKVQYTGASQYYEMTPLFNNKELYKKAEISNNYYYKIDFILGSNEKCAVEVKHYNSTYILSENNNRLILPVENLILVSKNCDAVVTIVSNKNVYKSYYVSENDVKRAKFEATDFTLFKVPEKETNIRVLRFAIQAGYKIGNDYYPCNIFNAGMILIHGLFIEQPINHIEIYKEGDYRYLNFINPYYFENPDNKFKNDDYYIAFTCNCYFAKNHEYLKLEYSLYPSILDLKDAKYLVNNRMHQIGKAYETFDNFYQIDPPENDNVILTVSSSSCNSNTFSLVVLSDYDKIIHNQTELFSTFFFENCEKYIGKEALYINFENVDTDKVTFYYEYLPINRTYIFQPTNFPKQFNITNTINGKINISFYPVFFNEEVKYQLYIVKSNDLFQSLCNFYSIDDTNKKIIDIGIYNINNDSIGSNQPLNKEIDINLYFTSKQTLKIGLFYKTINNYKIQNLLIPISFEYNPINDKDKEDKDNKNKTNPDNKSENGNSNHSIYNMLIYIGVGSTALIIIIIVIYCIIKNNKNKNQIKMDDLKGSLI